MKTESRLWEQTATFQQSWRARTWKPGKWKYVDYKGAFHKKLFCSKIISFSRPRLLTARVWIFAA